MAAVLVVSGSGPAHGSAPVHGAVVDPVARARMMNGEYGLAAARLRRELLADPGSLDKEALLGVAEARNGAYPDALAAFDSGRLADSYGREAIEAHADVLRVLAPAGWAAALRNEQLWMGPSPLAELEIFLDLADDHRADGDLQSALDAASMALTVAPDRGAPYAQLAEIWMDLGRWDDARADLQLADWLGPRSAYIARASVRFLMHEGQLDEAREISTLASSQYDADLELRALRAELATASGTPDEAIRLTTGKRFPDSVQPQMLLAAIHAYESMGATSEARAAADRFRAIYRRPVLNALGTLESPSPP